MKRTWSRGVLSLEPNLYFNSLIKKQMQQMKHSNHTFFPLLLYWLSLAVSLWNFDLPHASMQRVCTSVFRQLKPNLQMYVCWNVCKLHLVCSAAHLSQCLLVMQELTVQTTPTSQPHFSFSNQPVPQTVIAVSASWLCFKSGSTDRSENEMAVRILPQNETNALG